MATGIFASLPKPKYTGEHEEVPEHAKLKGTRIVGPGVINESEIVLKVGTSNPYVLEIKANGHLSVQDHLHTDNDQDGDHEAQMTLEMAVLSQKYLWLNTLWTWVAKELPRLRMRWRYKSTRKERSNTMQSQDRVIQKAGSYIRVLRILYHYDNRQMKES